MALSGQDIVVGYDDTTASMAAARWAAELAEDLGSDLRLVHAWTWPLVGQGMQGVPVLDAAGPRNQASRLLDDAAERLAAHHPDLRVTAQLMAGTPREALEEISEEIALLVVGTRGLGAVLGALLGSVSRGILHDAGCPVAIIRSDQLRAGPVLVADDGSATAAGAVDIAAELAAAWGVELRVLHVRAGTAGAAAAEDAAGGDDGILERGLARARAGRDALEVTGGVLEGRSAAEALLEAATGARLLVLGHRGRSRSAVGSTAHATVLHATGNVMVVRGHGEGAAS